MVEPGRIILKQRGTEWHEGPGVGRAKDHTLYALQKGRVVFRYDVASQRRYVTVSDCSGVEAPLVGTGSRTETKQRVADAVDAQKYLSLNHLERRDYVLGLAKKLDRESEQEKKEQLAARLMQPKRATFSLVDLTML
ncbi:hypothetical protein HDU83_005586 [Entophlyctis luteolus]|nr:hypothetical protein HDU83_005586 [Entophlyctis luteolus]